MSEVVVYTTSSCPYCRQVKQYLDSKGVAYQEKNLTTSPTFAAEMVQRSGQQGVPVTIIENEVIVGFNQPALAQAIMKLKASGNRPAGGFKLGAKVAEAAQILAGQGQARREGAIVGSITPGSPAAQAGLREGDIIIALGSYTVRNVSDLQNALTALSGLPIAGLAGMAGVAFWRDGQRHQAKLPLR